VVGELALEVVDLSIGSLPLVFGGETFDPLDENTSIPGAVEDHDLLVVWGFQATPEAPQVMMGLVLSFRRCDRVDLVATRVDLFGRSPDGTPLARRVPPFHDDDQRPLLLVQPECQLAELELTLQLPLPVLLAVQSPTQIDCGEHQ